VYHLLTTVIHQGELKNDSRLCLLLLVPLLLSFPDGADSHAHARVLTFLLLLTLPYPLASFPVGYPAVAVTLLLLSLYHTPLLLLRLTYALPPPWYTLPHLLAAAAGHAGYELSPFIPTLEGLSALLVAGWGGSGALNTVQHHDLHHR
jgi:hypothetical protein